EGRVVAGGLLIAGGHAAELLGLAPEALHQVAVLVALRVDDALHLAALLCGDDRTGTQRLDPRHDRLAVVALVRDHHLHLRARRRGRGKQRLGVTDVGVLAGRDQEAHRQAQAADHYVDLGREAAPAAAEAFRLRPAAAVGFFSAPAACWWARTTVESRMSHSRSGSCRSWKIRCQRPFCAQRLKRFQTLFQLPKRSGRSRQAAPVLASHSTASMNRRLSWAVTPGAPALPGSRVLMRSKSWSLMAWRGGMASPHVAVLAITIPAADDCPHALVVLALLLFLLRPGERLEHHRRVGSELVATLGDARALDDAAGDRVGVIQLVGDGRLVLLVRAGQSISLDLVIDDLHLLLLRLVLHAELLEDRVQVGLLHPGGKRQPRRGVFHRPQVLLLDDRGLHHHLVLADAQQLVVDRLLLLALGHAVL